MTKNTIILFDLDGTLIDSTEAIVSTFYHSFEIMNFNFKGDDETIKELIGYPLDIMYSKLGVDEKYVWDFVNTYKNRYREISKEKTLLLKDAYKAVQMASSFARVSVVTTKTRKYTIPLLEHFGINEFFEIVTGRECVENPKPHPEPIIKTLELMNHKPEIENVWMIGDTKLDLQAANDANINSIGVLCGYGKKEELKKYTNFIEENALNAIMFIRDLKK